MFIFINIACVSYVHVFLFYRHCHTHDRVESLEFHDEEQSNGGQYASVLQYILVCFCTPVHTSMT